MTVERARTTYQRVSKDAAWCQRVCGQSDRWPMPLCTQALLLVDAASIVLDLANAEASIERIRRSVAW